MDDMDNGDGIHCKQCYSCDSFVCEECGLCEECAGDDQHCMECGRCLVNGEIDMCYYGGNHCSICCEEEGYACAFCGRCTEALGLDFCDDCGYCEICCSEFTETDEDCTHGLCIFSSDFADHLCPNCSSCPQDTECEYCGMCEDCQDDYHCEHGLCPDGNEWDDHLCTDCGECTEPDELCEYCGKCEDCASSYHCDHGYCPEGDESDSFDHFICPQCDECYEGDEPCEYCDLCPTCCLANTEAEGCDHELCIESDDFAEHWCYEDGQCLEQCDHNPDCAHNNVSSTWNSDGTAHWHVCADCGLAVDRAIHTEGAPVNIVDPDPVSRKNGKANVSCTVCEQQMAVITVPYVAIPEDGSPYITTQPKDYTGKTNTSAWTSDPSRYATFTVRAGGKNLSYQWYEKCGSLPFMAITDKEGYFEGTQTASLKALVFTDACDDTDYYKYYCVVTNASGSVTTNTVAIKAQHVFGHYLNNGDGTHSYVCLGECNEVKTVSKHRFGEWTLVRPATDTQEGLREQKCIDCSARNQETLPKVEPGHVHVFDQPIYNATEHWFSCKCGIVSPDPRAPHTWGEPVITVAPTEKKTGKQEISCTACGLTLSDIVDKLPHTHDFYELNADNYDSGKAGYSSVQHFSYCKSCDQINAQSHQFTAWEITSKATATKSGTIARECLWCPYFEKKFYNYGTYPIMVIGGTASHDAAAPGTIVTITYDKHPNWYWGETSFWQDQYWEGGPVVPMPTVTPNMNSKVITFTMPNGPVAVEAYIGTCHHIGGTELGKRVEPTCSGYGHEPDEVCIDCGAVITEGERIPALGHDRAAEPIAGTAVIGYCTNYDNSPSGVNHGYSGDFLCNRCHKTVKGERTPLTHGQLGRSEAWNNTWSNVYEIRDEVENTCTTDGYSGDTYCKLCNTRVKRGQKVARTGHEFDDWVVVREATPKLKGQEERICHWCHTYKETRLVDFTGIDHTLKADKTKLSFTWTYGEEPEPQTVVFTSTGLNAVTAISKVIETAVGGTTKLAFDGLKLTVTPDVAGVISKKAEGTPEVLHLSEVVSAEGPTSDFNAPDITVSFTIKKSTVPIKIEEAEAGLIAYIGEPMPAPVVVTPEAGLEVTWTSSDNSVAVVDANTGEVTPLNAGTTSITATFAGNDYYKSSKASYTLVVRHRVELLAPEFSITGGTEAEPTMLAADEPLKVTFDTKYLDENELTEADVIVKLTVSLTGDVTGKELPPASKTAHVVTSETFYLPLGTSEFPEVLHYGYTYDKIVIEAAELQLKGDGSWVATCKEVPAELTWVGVKPLIFDGVIKQIVSHPLTGVQGEALGEQTVTIAPAEDPGEVNITFSGFQMPVTGGVVPEFTVEGAIVTQNDDGTISYSLPSYAKNEVIIDRGTGDVKYSVALEGSQTSQFALPVLKLELTNSVVDDIWFGADEATINKAIILDSVEGVKANGGAEGIYDVAGRKLNSVGRGISIISSADGKAQKVSAK